MNIRMEHGLPIASFTVHYDGNTLLLDNVLLDTGCATTIFDSRCRNRVRCNEWETETNVWCRWI
ncbi:hypothetical protein [Bacillus sp. UNC322MFChir4.1]|uniref:hypothetical protein n=1 Tax=Bacillus sp. UNC322MFChir4.1 TaxID=1449045 RepID=UPI001E61726D|nr:hypothetical protein [Bacillus sp. UNC322MFChir4.1]